MEFSRQPRVVPEYPAGEIDIESPVSIGTKPEISWFQTFIAPVIMICVTVLVYLAGRVVRDVMSNPLYLMSSLAVTAVSIISSVIRLNSQFSKYAKQKKSRNKKYLEYIKQKDAELSIAAEQQSRVLKQMNPSPNECIERMNSTPADPKLWERTPAFPDFLSFRLGIGTAKAALHVSNAKTPSIMETDPLAAEPQKLALKHGKVQDVPICVDLRSTQICGIVGGKEKTVAAVNRILIQLAANHGYDNVRVFIFAKGEALSQWTWTRFLPHCWNDSLTSRRMVHGKDTAKLTIDEVYDELKERENKGSDAVFSSYYMFIVESPEIIEDVPIRKYIYEPNARIGVTAIFTADHTAYLPTHCGAIVTLKEKTGEVIDLVKNEKSVFVPDVTNTDNLEMAARRIAPLRIKSISTSFSLPKTITLCQMLNTKDLSRVDILGKWNSRRTYNGMDVPIGVKTAGEFVSLDLHETGHGPHGLVAGTTGSGKSELLQSIIISLAIHFHPHDVIFVLIDYKGGGMADVFKGMPHLAGIITNLGGGQTTRALLSIKSEIQRRQTIFAQYSVNNIDKYQRLFYRTDHPEGMPPVPHLIMIADEFAELQQEQPDFMKQLVSAARVGRSLGIHLILATQKPDGVVDDQIWSNSKFKICLKVQTESDSNGVLKKPDAAFIREPGRAYIKVGNDEIYELFQSAYSGADYNLDAIDAAEKLRREKKILRLSVDGRPTQIFPRMGAERMVDDGKNQSQLEAMVKHIAEQSEGAGIIALHGPWTEPLEEIIYINELPDAWTNKSPQTILSAVVGIVDDPRGQRKFPLEFDFAANGGLLIYGASGTGKTTLIKSICLALASRYSPAEVNIYILDMGGAALKIFRGLAHCGGVLTVDQERDIRQFIRFLFRTVESRKKIFEDENIESFTEYRKKGFDMPAVVVVVDVYAALAELYPDVDEQLTLFIRDAFRYGIYPILTGMTGRDIRYKLETNFRMAAALELIDKSYSEIVGRTEGLEPGGFCGRGLVKLDKPMEFQAALPEYRLDGEVVQTREIIEQFTAKETCSAIPIPIMPEKVDFKAMNAGKTELWIALFDDDLTKAALDFSEYTSFIIAGGQGSGKSSIAEAWLGHLDHAEVYVMDSSTVGLRGTVGKPNTIDLSELDMESFVGEFEELLDHRRSELSEMRKSGGDVDALVSSWKQIIFVFDKFTEAADDNEYYQLMDLVVRIIKKEHGMKVMVLALDTPDDISSDYSDASRALKNNQNGVLLGSIREQALFNVSLPFAVPEKELAFGDGYLIKKNRFAGIRLAI